jgi:hypothetical protein
MPELLPYLVVLVLPRPSIAVKGPMSQIDPLRPWGVYHDCVHAPVVSAA